MELIKIHDARLIPRELVEQVPHMEVEEFYTHMQETWKHLYDFLYAILDEKRCIKGFIWYQVNVMNKSIFINTISICDEWKNQGKVEEIAEFIKKDMLQMGLTKVFFLTDKPSFYEKMGLVKTKEVLLIGDFENGFK